MKDRVINITTKLGRTIAIASTIMVAAMSFTGTTTYAASFDMGGAIYSEDYITENENTDNYGGAIYWGNNNNEIAISHERGGAIYSENINRETDISNDWGGAIYSENQQTEKLLSE